MATLARRLGKLAFFLLLLLIVGRAMGEPYNWINYDFALKLGHILYGSGEIGAEAIDDTYFYMSFLTNIVITAAIFFITMKLIRKVR
ncbi:hypothetical protein ABEH22_04095 [Pantoea agglomerans]|jgi:hypothetical protein|uniref:hypothetical protein n=1 Tax=Pantoea TaxID=53335 RepID=UPI0002553AFF|nr:MULTISPECIES: hypothetical protein [Pantoea]ERM10775.1 hypothetical protein L584_11330 [Pantoea agglomerans Tx10]MBD8199245.1 hypothetical protein [Pantoea agglomerans]MBD8250695.1 hypothetical protein [Pantoea agglomerans]MBO0638491.1 hypothetical protein [Pantoea agglomerans]MCL6412509.1 hypothetical protein [Pantoea agglomerans]